MKDINGKEIKTGDIVRISGAYFKNDNGYYFVTHSPGDISWCGEDYGLKKIGVRGKVQRKVGFWPIIITVNNPDTKWKAKEWNKENATIEVMDAGIVPFENVKEYFKNEIVKCEKTIEWSKFNGYEPQYKLHSDIKNLYESVLKRIAG